ncbi:hypothetical protein I8751_10705 [Nostocaceae cyanobacterium CENA357]|uniref:Uncharacterized protein n=1 Tax=Atlanticothrix silvestris CENA357 TaxID=1725252 RepID=A0A8J7HH57_9CYAN|nr:hypothetical protein [Atlanticothrix silvestris]MBH8552829.1 hypothetical protein [Atlanticothrix silvestris CENA357]
MAITESGVITYAYGASYYIEMAKSLARSLRLHSPKIPRAIVTDNQHDRELFELFDYVISCKKEYGSNVVQKLHLYDYSPFKRTLYIDSDCIAVRDINFIFDAFKGRSFGVTGDVYLQAGDKDTFINVDDILNRFALTKLPKFNGGLYYFEQSSTAKAVFETALEVLRDWKKLGISAFRGDGPNDERIIAIAMMLHNQTLFQDQGQMMRTPIGLRGSLDVDVITGKSTFQKDSKVVSPALVHFACVWAEHPVYYREVSKLKDQKKITAYRVNPDVFSAIQYKFGYQIALARYIAKRVPKNYKYVQARATKFLRQLPEQIQTKYSF